MPTETAQSQATLYDEISAFIEAEIKILRESYGLSQEQAGKIVLHQIKLHPISDVDSYDVQEILEND
jgi:DNA-binding transcriptional regulator YiaG